MPHAVVSTLGSGLPTSFVDAATAAPTRHDLSSAIAVPAHVQLPLGAMPPMDLPALFTPTLLEQICSQPNLPSNVWYFIAGVTLSSLNRPDEIPKVLQHAIERGVDGVGNTPLSHVEQLQTVRRMREALVKSAAIVGLPKTINALFALKTATPASLLDTASTSPTSRTSDLSSTPTTILRRGQRFFDRVYGKVNKRVMSQMDNCGTEDLGVTARLMYGYLLSDLAVLNEVETSWVMLAGLVGLDCNAQLKGHLRGACNNGATREEVLAVREIVIMICEASGMKRLEEGVVGGWGWRADIASL